MNITWILLSLFCVALEIGNPGLLYFLAMSCGALAAFLVTLQGYSFEAQAIVFFTVTIFSAGLIYLFVKASVDDSKKQKSNVDLLIGQIVTVVQVKTETSGTGKVKEENWSIKLIDQKDVLKIGMKAIVVGVQGCHLRVQKIK